MTNNGPKESPKLPNGQASLRHDLKNHLTAMRSGCALLERYLNKGDTEQVRFYISQMQQEIANGFSIAERMPTAD